MAEYKVQRKKSIRFFNDLEVRAVWDDEQNCWWFSATDIVRAIKLLKEENTPWAVSMDSSCI